MVEAFKKVAKGAAIIAHKLVLAQQEIAKLRAANKAATRRKSHKRKRIQAEGTLTVKDGLRLTTLKEFGARSNGKKAKKPVRAKVGEPSQRRCGRCNQTGHNARTCKQDVEVVSEWYSRPYCTMQRQSGLFWAKIGCVVVWSWQKWAARPCGRLAREVRYRIAIESR